MPGEYTPLTWIEGLAPGISAINLNHLETQFAQATLEIQAGLKPPVVRWSTPGWYWHITTARLMTAARIYYIPIYPAFPLIDSSLHITVCREGKNIHNVAGYQWTRLHSVIN